MIKRYGDQAAFEAGRRAAALFDEGDLGGQRAWHRIIDAIHSLQTVKPGEMMN